MLGALCCGHLELQLRAVLLVLAHELALLPHAIREVFSVGRCQMRKGERDG